MALFVSNWDFSALLVVNLFFFEFWVSKKTERFHFWHVRIGPNSDD